MQDCSEQTLASPVVSINEEKLGDKTANQYFFDLSIILTDLGFDYVSTGLYWQVGASKKVQGWILHLSVILPQFEILAKRVLPLLKKENITFKIVRNSQIASKILTGDYGVRDLAKLITIYPSDDRKAVQLASTIIHITKDLKGPSIPSDFCLGNIVYTRYGSISPIWINDPKGTPIKHIYNEKGELTPDPCPIPFAFPIGAAWPFSQIAQPVIHKPIKLVNARYYPISPIRENARGDIMKAIYFKKFWNIKACVIKQGRRNMSADFEGRTVADRLRWQYEVCKEMAGVIPVPKIFDYFIENEDTYLAMEFVKGKDVKSWLDDIYNKRSWFELPDSDKIAILDILLRVVSIVHRLHQRGYIHRDITAGNFIITRKNEVVPIDLELTWPSNSPDYTVPFLLGTPGYMSPQQENAERPTEKDDIFAIGALSLVAYTRLSPSKFSIKHPQELHSSLNFFTRDKRLSALIANCLQTDPQKRPDLGTVENTLNFCISAHRRPTQSLSGTDTELVSSDKLVSIVQAAINKLAKPELLTAGGQWISISSSTTTVEYSRQVNETSNIGWHSGVSGPLWLLALAKSAGFDVQCCKEAYKKNWEYIQSHFSNIPPDENPSLFHGCAGVALAVQEGIQGGLLSSEDEILSMLQACFPSSPTELTLSSGVAGQGIALLQASSNLGAHYSNPLLTSYLDILLALQRPDGSWPLEMTVGNKTFIPLGLTEGIAGIIWFLLSYLQHSADSQVESVTRRGLSWVINNKIAKQTWKPMRPNKSGKDWVSSQTPGDISALMIKAYKVLADPQYKLLAESGLDSMPGHPISSNFSLKNGLARLGELYLEGSLVLRNDRYRDRASWLANFFVHTFLPGKNDEGHWVVFDNDQVTADLFEGNSGIIHFLMRYLKPNEIPYPFY